MVRFRWAFLALATALPAAASTIVPPQPTAQQAVELRLTVDSCTFNPATVKVAASGTTLRVTQRLNNCLAPGTPAMYDVRLGNFPAGDYRVEVYDVQPATGTPPETLSFSVTNRVEVAIVPPPVHPLTNYSGFWWSPDQPGWGLALVQDPVTDHLFGAWFFNVLPDHKPSWSTLQNGTWGTPTSWGGAVYDTTGPTLEQADHTPTTVVGVHPISLNFSGLPSGNPMIMAMVVGGSVLLYRLQRFEP